VAFFIIQADGKTEDKNLSFERTLRKKGYMNVANEKEYAKDAVIMIDKLIFPRRLQLAHGELRPFPTQQEVDAINKEFPGLNSVYPNVT